MTFGGIPGTNVTLPDSNTITVTTPSHAAGTVSVVVTNAIAQSATLTNAYTYTPAPPTGGGGGGGTIRFVQVKSATPQTASSSVSVTYSAAQTAGNLNVVEVGWNDTSLSQCGERQRGEQLCSGGGSYEGNWFEPVDLLR